MSKNKLNLLVDVLAYVAMACLASTGLTTHYLLPPGTGGRESGQPALTLLGLGRHDWGDIHFYIALTLVGLVVLHIVLHWKWVTNTFGALVRPRGAKAAGAGAGGAVLLVVLGLVAAALIAAPWLIGVTGHERPGRGQRLGESPEPTPEQAATEGKGQASQAPEEHGAGQSSIRGSSTLAEAAREAGVPVAQLLAELKLPPDTPPGEQLGRLRRQLGFTMEDVRAAVERLKKARD